MKVKFFNPQQPPPVYWKNMHKYKYIPLVCHVRFSFGHLNSSSDCSIHLLLSGLSRDGELNRVEVS